MDIYTLDVQYGIFYTLVDENRTGFAVISCSINLMTILKVL